MTPCVPSYTDIRAAYERTGLVPCKCGPELRRLDDGRLGCGPFVALYVAMTGIDIRSSSDAKVERIERAAETWAYSIFECPAAYLAGWDREGVISRHGVPQISLPELLAYHAGDLASMFIQPTYVPFVAASPIVPEGAPC